MFRASLVGGVGYCARSRRREALTGSERRECWTGTATSAADGFFGRQPDIAPAAGERGLLEVLPARGGSADPGAAALSEQ